MLADVAVLIADGGRAMSALATLRDQGELFGPVAFDPTLWCSLHEICEPQRHRIVRARSVTREYVSSLIAQRHGRNRAGAGGRPRSERGNRDPHGRLAGDRPRQQGVGGGDMQGHVGPPPAGRWCDNTCESWR